MDEVVGPYRILRVLGEGGMGVVYAARDERLERTVALKRVHPAGPDPEARRRLWREARAAAGISHPHVCQVYDVLERGDDLFVAMELLEGESLAARLRRGPLPIPEGVRVGCELLSALGALHARGLVHRDVKPSNVFLTPHGAKLLDFGLAAPAPEARRDGERLTATGMLLGTPGYMAPEQFTGGDVGPAADLFAAGALLFEALSGRAAFEGASPVEVFHAVAYGPAPVLSGGTLATALDRVLQGALARRPEDRPASAAQMAEALAAAGRTPGPTGEVPRVRALRRLIVLPFRMLRPDPDVDFLALALPEAVATSLAGLDALVVRSPHAAQRFGGASPDLEALARGAEVDAALAGTLQRGGDRLRVAVQLLDAPAGTVRWSQTSQVALGDLFTLQDELADRIVSALHVPLTGAERRALHRDAPASPRAYELYLRANEMAKRPSLWLEARDLYREAVAEDPRYAPAWARLGRVHRVLAKYGQEGAEGLVQAEEAFRRAFELDPDLAAAHHLFTHFEVEEQGRPREAMTRLLRRAAVHGNEPELFAGLVVALRFCGLLEASLAADERARRLDPSVRTSVPYTLWMAGDYEGALRRDDGDVPWIRIYTLPMLGREAEALALARAEEGVPAYATLRADIACQRTALEGDRAGTVAHIRPVLGSTFHDPEGLYFLARTLARVGETGLALETLARIVQGGFTVPVVLRSDPWLASVRGAPAFAALLERAEAGRAEGARAYREANGEALVGVRA